MRNVIVERTDGERLHRTHVDNGTAGLLERTFFTTVIPDPAAATLQLVIKLKRASSFVGAVCSAMVTVPALTVFRKNIRFFKI